MKFPNHIKKFRKKTGITQQELASLVGLATRHHMSRIENGHVLPNSKNMAKIAAILKERVSDIFLI